jgi:alkylhydroperoxidase family enzyme
MPLIPRILLGLVERRLGKALIANRILAWYPKALIGSGLMEALVAHDEAEVPKRLLKLLRMYTSFRVSCPFCIDMNSEAFAEIGVTEEEILALRGIKAFDDVASLDERERAALAYAECISRTPLRFEAETVDRLKSLFSERAIVVIASTCAQVNFWARLIQSFGVAPAGFTENCSLLDLDRYRTGEAPRDRAISVAGGAGS